MKFFITGAGGQLGKCLIDELTEKGLPFVAFTKEELDIVDANAVYEKLEKCRPDIVVNAAAYTDVDGAESNKEKAYAINKDGPENLATVCNTLKIRLIHISTDYVFDGLANTPYLPEHDTNPTSVYGLSKLAGEKAVKESGASYLIIRTAWVYSEYGKNFFKTILRLAKDRDSLSVVNDQIGNPTYAGDLAKVIVAISVEFLKGNLSNQILHYGGIEVMSWYDFSKKIIQCAVDLKLLKCSIKVTPTDSASYPSPVKRPLYSVLDSDKLAKFITSRPIEHTLTALLSKL